MCVYILIIPVYHVPHLLKIEGAVNVANLIEPCVWNFKVKPVITNLH